MILKTAFITDIIHQYHAVWWCGSLSGHCGKMMAIISKFGSSSELQDRAWLVIADDDTLLRYVLVMYP